jgi:hypothetical protein
MKALVFENKVIEVASTEFEVHESMIWMGCSAECKAGEWEVVDGNLQAIPEPEDTRTYADFRQQAYPSTADQLDDIYHNGVDGWKATIKAVKDTYPKETI